MKRHALLPLLALLAGAVLVRADQTDDAIVAAMKLSSVVNYSWTTTIDQNSRTMGISGKTSAEGYSLLTFTGFSGGGGTSSSSSASSSASSSSSSSTSKSGTGGGVDTVFLGDSKYVMASGGNWVVPADTSSSAPTDTSNNSSASNSGTSSTRSKRTRAGTGGVGGTGTSGQRRGNQDSSSSTPGPKLPSGVNLPHEELAIVASNYSEMHFADGVVTGTLTEWGADQLLVPPGWMQSPPDKAAGTFRLWIKDGAVTKYELKMTAETGPGGVTIKGGLAKTITVELTDVGTTTVTVPPAAKLKLSM